MTSLHWTSPTVGSTCLLNRPRLPDAWQPRPAPHYQRGYGWVFAQHVLQADKGCDFDFLRVERLHTPQSGGGQAS